MSAQAQEVVDRPVVVHNVTPDGRLMHNFEKVNGVWCCPCGERRDNLGRPLPPQESL